MISVEPRNSNRTLKSSYSASSMIQKAAKITALKSSAVSLHDLGIYPKGQAIIAAILPDKNPYLITDWPPGLEIFGTEGPRAKQVKYS